MASQLFKSQEPLEAQQTQRTTIDFPGTRSLNNRDGMDGDGKWKVGDFRRSPDRAGIVGNGDDRLSPPADRRRLFSKSSPGPVRRDGPLCDQQPFLDKAACLPDVFEAHAPTYYFCGHAMSSKPSGQKSSCVAIALRPGALAATTCRNPTCAAASLLASSTASESDLRGPANDFAVAKSAGLPERVASEVIGRRPRCTTSGTADWPISFAQRKRIKFSIFPQIHQDRKSQQ